jgi:para-aminobenzoate synthetase component 1
MNMRFPTVITLPWRADAAEFWFARLSHLPFAMLLHSGHADHPYSRFDILVADPLKTLTTDDLSLTDDPLMQLQQAINALGLSAAPNPDLPFRAARWACLATIWVAVSKRCPSMRRLIFPCQTWPWGCMTGR